MLDSSLSSAIVDGLKTALEAAFTAKGLSVPMDSYGILEPLTDEYKGSIDVQVMPIQSPGSLDRLHRNYVVTVEAMVKKSNGYDALTDIYDLHEFLLFEVFRNIAVSGIQIVYKGTSTVLQGLVYEDARTILKEFDDKTIGQSIIRFSWSHTRT